MRIFVEWALDDSPGVVRLVAWSLVLPLTLLAIPLTWLVVPRATFDKWWQP